MTKTQKEKWLERLFGIVSAIIVSIAIYSFTSSKDESKALINKVNELDKTKASTEYVDKKCLEVQTKSEKDRSEIMERLDRMEIKQDKTLDYIIELNKRK